MRRAKRTEQATRTGRGIARKTHLVSLGSAKGGVGRSTIIVELARALARRGSPVLLVDFNPETGGLSALLGGAKFSVRSSAEIPDQPPSQCAQKTGIQDVSLLCFSGLSDGSVGKRGTLGLARWLRCAAERWVLVDLPGGIRPDVLSMFLASDLSMIVSGTEPAGLIANEALLRASLLRMFGDVLEERRLLSPSLAQRLKQSSWSFQTLESSLDEAEQSCLYESSSRLSLGLLLNQTRSNNEQEQSWALAHAWGKFLGTWPRIFKGVQFDDRRWFFNRRLAPPSYYPREDTMLGDVDVLAHQLMTLDWIEWDRPKPCLPRINPTRDARTFLDLSGKMKSEARQHYRRLWEAYRREPGLVSFVLDETRREEMLSHLNQAYRELRFSLFESNPSIEIPVFSQKTEQHIGHSLKVARRRMGLGLRELSLRTRVSVKYIQAIEDVQIKELPALAYLKAYVIEIARALGLDPEVLVEDYLEGLERIPSR